MLTIDDIKKMLETIDKHTNKIINNSKYKDNITLANCVLALSAIIQDIMKI